MRTVLTLGRQESILTRAWTRHLSATYGAPVSDLDCEKEPYAEAFFRGLGAEKVDSMDYSDYQGCTICRDLNDPVPSTPPTETYDLVYDGGTLEHVFNFPNAIANCMSLVKTGGHFMCSAPANQWLGHGFYQFSPELFFRVLAPENGFEMVRVFLVEFSDREGKIYRVIDPAESGVRTLLESPHEMLLLVWAKKISDVAPFHTWPKQSDYAARWQAGTEREAVNTATEKSLAAHARSLVGRLVPERVKMRMVRKKHLGAARHGLVRMDHLQ